MGVFEIRIQRAACRSAAPGGRVRRLARNPPGTAALPAAWRRVSRLRRPDPPRNERRHPPHRALVLARSARRSAEVCEFTRKVRSAGRDRHRPVDALQFRSLRPSARYRPAARSERPLRQSVICRASRAARKPGPLAFPLRSGCGCGSTRTRLPGTDRPIDRHIPRRLSARVSVGVRTDAALGRRRELRSEIPDSRCLVSDCAAGTLGSETARHQTLDTRCGVGGERGGAAPRRFGRLLESSAGLRALESELLHCAHEIHVGRSAAGAERTGGLECRPPKPRVPYGTGSAAVRKPDRHRGGARLFPAVCVQPGFLVDVSVLSRRAVCAGRGCTWRCASRDCRRSCHANKAAVPRHAAPRPMETGAENTRR
jgi:hypothetical protein